MSSWYWVGPMKQHVCGPEVVLSPFHPANLCHPSTSSWVMCMQNFLVTRPGCTNTRRINHSNALPVPCMNYEIIVLQIWEDVYSRSGKTWEENINFKSQGVPFLSPMLVSPLSSPKPDGANFCYIIKMQERPVGLAWSTLSLHCVTSDARCTAHFCHFVTLSGCRKHQLVELPPIRDFFGTLWNKFETKICTCWNDKTSWPSCS